MFSWNVSIHTQSCYAIEWVRVRWIAFIYCLLVNLHNNTNTRTDIKPFFDERHGPKSDTHTSVVLRATDHTANKQMRSASENSVFVTTTDSNAYTIDHTTSDTV